MQKLLMFGAGALVALAIAVGVPQTVAAQPAAAKPASVEPPSKDEGAAVVLDATGSFFTRYEYRRHYDDLNRPAGRFGEMDQFFYRARLGLATRPIDIGDEQQVVLRFVPQGSGSWAADRAGTLADSVMGVHEAVFRLKRDRMWLDVGRFEMIYGDHLVVGNVDWHQTGRAFDGARARFELAKKGAWIDGFVTQVAEGGNGTTTLGAGDKMFLGTYAALGAYLGPKVAWDAYAFAHVWPSTSGRDTAIQGTLGTRYKRKMGRADVRTEAGVQIGKRVVGGVDVDALAFQGEGELGFAVAPKLRLAVGGFFASGDDPATTDKNEGWDQLYPTAHKFLGFMDVMGGRNNAMGAMVRVRAKASPALGVGFDGHLFLRPEVAMGVDSYAGVEANAWTVYRIGKGLGLRTAYNVFVANETGPFAPATSDSNIAHYVEIQFRYDLK